MVGDTVKDSIFQKLKSLLVGKSFFDQKTIEEMEEILLRADVGPRMTHTLLEQVRRSAQKTDLIAAMKDIMRESLSQTTVLPGAEIIEGPEVIVFVGVNGAGKTTALGKIAYQMSLLGKKVYIAAADTFRAAAVEQLKIVAAHADAKVIHQEPGADPAAVVYDALASAKANNAEVLLIDTAGRLHSNDNLMRELEKVMRTLKKLDSSAPHRVYLVLDAACGQNALYQAQNFAKVANLTGVILNKLDGTAKGGMVFSIQEVLGLPISYVGYGEKITDFQVFDADEFIEDIFA